jgi:hypothetical protein
MEDTVEHPEDQGTSFGTWPDPTAQLMYHDIMPLALSGIDTSGKVADFGGGNGLLREWIPHAVSVDYDTTKKPDVYADILTHRGTYDLIIMRYVLHYMRDEQVKQLFDNIAEYHNGRVLLIQFVNNDLAIKNYNSVGEVKYFRGEPHLASLIDQEKWLMRSRKAVAYRVGAEFYKWRLGHLNPMTHDEIVVIYELEPRKVLDE